MPAVVLSAKTEYFIVIPAIPAPVEQTAAARMCRRQSIWIGLLLSESIDSGKMLSLCETHSQG